MWEGGAVCANERDERADVLDAAKSVLVALLRRELVKANGFGDVLLHAQAHLKHKAQVELSTGQVFGSRELVQADCLSDALRDAESMAVPERGSV